jgi:hypothetical protein
VADRATGKLRTSRTLGWDETRSLILWEVTLSIAITILARTGILIMGCSIVFSFVSDDAYGKTLYKG